MAKQDYYEILGVKRDANEKQIKSAYRQAARKYHPDVNKEPSAREKFQEATEAYEVLSDPEKRKKYDQFGHAAPHFAGQGGPRQAYTQYGGVRAGGGGFSFSDFFGGGGSGFGGMSLDDILSALGGGGARRAQAQAQQAPRRGADIEHEVTIDFMQAVFGMTATLRMQRPGTASPETIDVKIPAGVKDGSRVRVRGKGSSGRGNDGDLYIKIHVRPHPYFRREGDDIYLDVPLSITEAALGAKVEVPTIDGMTKMTVPPGTSTGRKLRLREKGIQRAGSTERGNQYVVFQVMVPETLSEKGRKLLEELAKSDPYNPRARTGWK